MAAEDPFGHRRGSALVRVLDAAGAPLRETDVVVEQVGHALGFGNIGFDLIDLADGRGVPDDEALAVDWLELFNTATLPFYWGDFEPTEGAPQTKRLRAAARWFGDRGVAVKGHPLVWHTVQPDWLRTYDLDGIEQRLRSRVRREVSAFRDVIPTWDAINELVIMPVFDRDDNAVTRLAWNRGRVAMAKLAFEEARAADPGATLLLNDFDLSTAYECLIEGLLEAGVRIDALGLQTHMHQGYRGEDEVLAIADRFARYGLPLHFTENSLVSGALMPADIEDLNDYQVDDWPSTPEGEARQADEIERHYRTLVSHPAVESITYWGITDRGAWLGAPIGLVRDDGSRKPAYDALRRLIKGEWWLPPTTTRTDAEGQVHVSGFAGDYLVRSGVLSAQVRLERGDHDARAEAWLV
ncbi:endo-1,4-beta-xylanase [Microbacterium sp. HD4P20]|uniref:endo-1,4-beta-xylanase n=1 Tax=Microbacterium sp. HD4P20 TaxID=2864874 RepID=UPI001C643B1A|nr:endo-1,4-beta-xylanase [Microbacterium sp. HD4P20]MCP2637937.1 endo-1,4-beta-xylanase [Microbacterium sp. HD4P20]